MVIYVYRNGSDWVLKGAGNIDLRVATHDPTRAGSYLKLPDKIRSSTSVLNIKNDDKLCALWSILAHLYPKYKDSARGFRSANPNAYKEHMDDINTGDLQFPLRISDIGKLERLNNLSINVFTLSAKSHVIPVLISNEKEVPKERVIDLLYIVHELNSHYCLITNIAGMLSKSILPPLSLQKGSTIVSGIKICQNIILIYRTMSDTAIERI